MWRTDRDRATISEQSKRIADLEATNEKMRNMLLAVKSHLASQKDAERLQRRNTAGEVVSPRSSTASTSGVPPAPAHSSTRPPSPPPEPPGDEVKRLNASPLRPGVDAAERKAAKKFQRNTLPLMGALGALLSDEGAAEPPAEPADDADADSNHHADADDDFDDHDAPVSPHLDPNALGPDGKPLDAKVREILRLQEEVARQRRLRNAPSPTAQPTKSILKKPGAASAAEAPKEKKSFFKRSQTPTALTKASETPSGRAAESTRRARVRFFDSPQTREERLAAAPPPPRAGLSASAPSASRKSPQPAAASNSSNADDDSPPPSPPPSDTSPAFRRASDTLASPPREPRPPQSVRSASTGSVSSSSPVGGAGSRNPTAPKLSAEKSKAIDDAWRSIEQDLFD